MFIASPSGRKRVNILGAINAVTKEITTVSNQTYINAQSVCSLLEKIKEVPVPKPITLVLDNARYQKCALVFELAQQLQIELLYLPSYSPHLNLIERLWKLIKKECLYSKYYPTFEEFQKAIEQWIQNANSEHQNKVDSLITWNFQSFRNVKISTV